MPFYQPWMPLLLCFQKPIPAVSTAQLFSLGGILQDHGGVGCVCPREPTGVHVGAADSATPGRGRQALPSLPWCSRGRAGAPPSSWLQNPAARAETGRAVPVLQCAASALTGDRWGPHPLCSVPGPQGSLPPPWGDPEGLPTPGCQGALEEFGTHSGQRAVTQVERIRITGLTQQPG